MKDFTVELQKRLWELKPGKDLSSPYFINLDFGEKVILNKLFPDSKKYFLELGSGWGEVAVELASKNPETGFLLMEKKINRVENTIKLLEKQNLSNIKFLNLNFNWFLEEVFLENSFDEILLNFPDPWPKAKHHKHRSFDEEFFESILKILKPDSRFRFATDFAPYGRKVIRLIRRKKNGYKNFGWGFERKDFPVSYFEGKKIKEGKKIYYLELYKS
ncbi:MAG: methyltransferase domain-containing protein [Leptospiraceae bacterium]|nr:methyltransferase domain-containing protein [Leptospiraceae bacterium]